MNYERFQYLYPPRPERAVDAEYLSDFDNGSYLAEPKLNGDCAVIFTDGKETVVMNRHKEFFKKSVWQLEEVAKTLHTGTGWLVLVGEWMAKGKKNKDGENFNGNLVLFDILVHNGVHLTDFSFSERYDLLDSLYPSDEYDDFIKRCRKPNLYLVECYTGGFRTAYDLLIETDMYEGLVLKKSKAPLEVGSTEKNNTRTQIKVRKPTENYHY